MSRVAKLAYRIAQSNVNEPEYPYRLTFAVTSRCQAQCIMCNIWQKPVATELSLEEIEQVFRRYQRFSWINLTGGELVLRQDLTDIVQIIDQYCPHLYLLNFSTNGFLTDAVVSLVKDILKSTSIPRLLVTVSLDGPPELHDTIRGLPGAWTRAVDTFRQLRQLTSRRFSVYLGFTIQKANIDAFDATIEAATGALGSVSMDEVHVNLAHVSGLYYANTAFNGVPEADAAAQILTRIGRIRKSRPFDPVSILEHRYRKLALNYQQSGKVPLTCQAAAVSCFIDPEGVVYPCSMFAAPIGSLREHHYDLGSIWRSAEKGLVRKKVVEAACPGCWTPCEAYQTILANLLRKGGS